MKNLNKKKNLKYIFLVISSLLAFAMVSQNCASKSGNHVLPQGPETPSTHPIIFKIDETYTANYVISDVLWQVRAHHYNKHDIGCYTGSYHKINFREINSGIELNWDDILQTDNTLGISLFIQAFIQIEGENCITYKRQSFQLVPSSSNDTDLICIQTAMSPPHISPTSETAQTSQYMIENLKTPLYHFSVGEPIDFELINLIHIEENAKFTWSIKNVEDDIELADQAHQEATLTHTFSEKGIYNISTTEEETHFELNTQIIIGKCENTNTQEVIIRVDSPTTSN